MIRYHVNTYDVQNILVASGWRGGQLWTSRKSDLDSLQVAYKTAVEQWIAAIREEESLASINHNEADVDRWEGASFREEEVREKAKDAKAVYERALRAELLNF